jgi:hypothetical protein
MIEWVTNKRDDNSGCYWHFEAHCPPLFGMAALAMSEGVPTTGQGAGNNKQLNHGHTIAVIF